MVTCGDSASAKWRNTGLVGSRATIPQQQKSEVQGQHIGFGARLLRETHLYARAREKPFTIPGSELSTQQSATGRLRLQRPLSTCDLPISTCRARSQFTAARTKAERMYDIHLAVSGSRRHDELKTTPGPRPCSAGTCLRYSGASRFVSPEPFCIKTYWPHRSDRWPNGAGWPVALDWRQSPAVFRRRRSRKLSPLDIAHETGRQHLDSNVVPQWKACYLWESQHRADGRGKGCTATNHSRLWAYGRELLI